MDQSRDEPQSEIQCNCRGSKPMSYGHIFCALCLVRHIRKSAELQMNELVCFDCSVQTFLPRQLKLRYLQQGNASLESAQISQSDYTATGHNAEDIVMYCTEHNLALCAHCISSRCALCTHCELSDALKASGNITQKCSEICEIMNIHCHHINCDKEKHVRNGIKGVDEGVQDACPVKPAQRAQETYIVTLLLYPSEANPIKYQDFDQQHYSFTTYALEYKHKRNQRKQDIFDQHGVPNNLSSTITTLRCEYEGVRSKQGDSFIYEHELDSDMSSTTDPNVSIKCNRKKQSEFLEQVTGSNQHATALSEQEEIQERLDVQNSDFCSRTLPSLIRETRCRKRTKQRHTRKHEQNAKTKKKEAQSEICNFPSASYNQDNYKVEIGNHGEMLGQLDGHCLQCPPSCSNNSLFNQEATARNVKDIGLLCKKFAGKLTVVNEHIVAMQEANGKIWLYSHRNKRIGVLQIPGLKDAWPEFTYLGQGVQGVLDMVVRDHDGQALLFTTLSPTMEMLTCRRVQLEYHPWSVTRDELTSQLVVCDKGNSHINIYTSTGNLNTTVYLKKRTCSGPRCAVLLGSYIIVCDRDKKNVIWIDLNGQAQKVYRGAAHHMLQGPVHMAVDTDTRTLFVVDEAGHCIHEINAHGQFVRIVLDSKDGVSNPTRIYLSDGILYTACSKHGHSKKIKMVQYR